MSNSQQIRPARLRNLLLTTLLFSGVLQGQQSPFDPNAYLRNKFEEARSEYRQGRSDRAEALARALLTLEPEIAFRNQVESFLEMLQDEKKELGNYLGLTRSPSSFIAWNTPTRISLLLLNQGTTNLTIEPVAQAESSSQNTWIEQRLLLTQYSLGGSVRRHRFTQTVKIEDRIDLAPGALWKTSFPLQFDTQRRDDAVIGVLRIECRLHGAQVEWDDLIPPTGFRFAALTLTFLPTGFQTLPGPPLQNLRNALQSGYAPQILTSGFLLTPSDYREGIDLLIEEVGDQVGPARRAVITLLQRMSQIRHPGESSAAWRAWWLAHKERYAPPRER
ncbi:MAG: hypothetical protein QF752_11545 [Planctomycetota bacterium]|nr:hypothetical protein [Planctomycetota bacterium]